MKTQTVNSTLALRLLGALLLATVLFTGFSAPVVARHKVNNHGDFAPGLDRFRLADLQLADSQLAGFQLAGSQLADFQLADSQLADKGSANISAAQAGNLAKRKYGGKVLKITPIRSGDGTDYRVRLLLDSGKVINVTVDGQTGRVR